MISAPNRPSRFAAHSQRVDGRLQILDTKTTTSVRQVAIGRLGADALRTHRTRQLEERLLGPSWAALDLVFPNRWGDLMNPDWFRTREFGDVLTRAGLRRIRFHDLRHTFATLQLANNQPIKIVSEMMGIPHRDHPGPLHPHLGRHAALRRRRPRWCDRPSRLRGSHL